MSLRIEINGVDLDINERDADNFYVTKQGHDLRNLETREATFTKGMNILMTDRNIEMLGVSMPNLAHDSQTSYTYFKCEVFMDEISIIQDALLYVVGIDFTARLIQATILGGSQLFFSQLNDNSIANLGWNEYNLEWSLANVSALANETDGIVTADASWHTNLSYREFEFNHVNGSGFQVGDTDINRSGFFVFVHTILDKILGNMIGLTFDLSAFDDTNLDILAISCPMQQFGDAESLIGGAAVVSAAAEVLPPDPLVLQIMDFPTVDYDPSGLWTALGGGVGAFYTMPDPSIVEVSVNITVLMEPDSPTILSDNEVVITNDDGTIVLKRYLVNSSANQSVTTIIQDKFKISVDQGATLQLRAIIQNAALPTNPNKMQYTGSFAVTYGSLDRFIQIGNWIPEITQRDFVRDLLKYYHMIPYENEGVVAFKRWEQMALDTASLVKIRINIKQGIRAVNSVGGYAQTNHFKYKDNKAVESNAFNSSFPILNKTIKESATKITSIYSGSDASETPVVGFTNRDRVCIPAYSFLYKEVNSNKMTITNGGLDWACQEETNLRAGDVIYYNGQRGEVEVLTTGKSGTFINSIGVTGNDQNWEYNSFKNDSFMNHIVEIRNNTIPHTFVYGNNETTIVANDNKVAVFDFQLFWTNYIDLHYSRFIDTMKKPLAITLDVVLTPSEFASLNPQIPIYIKEIGGMFYLNKISQYKPNSPTRLELIKIKYNLG